MSKRASYSFLYIRYYCPNSLLTVFFYRTAMFAFLNEKVRGRRRWFSRKYYASVMNIKEFFADNLGREYQGILSDIFDDKGLRGR